jgi:hypothetical protein
MGSTAEVAMHDDDLLMSQVKGGSVDAFAEPTPRSLQHSTYRPARSRAGCDWAYRSSAQISKRTLLSRRQNNVRNIPNERIVMDPLLLLIIALVVLSLAGGAFMSPIVFLLLIVVVVLFMGPYRGRRSRI